MNILLYLIAAPLIAGLAGLFIPKKMEKACGGFSLVVSVVTFILAVTAFLNKPASFAAAGSLMLRMDNLAGFVVLFIALAGSLIMLYSLGYMKGKENLKSYYGYMLMTIGASIGAALANDLVLF